MTTEQTTAPQEGQPGTAGHIRSVDPTTVGLAEITVTDRLPARRVESGTAAIRRQTESANGGVTHP